MPNFVYGITGSIATGKSTVANYFLEKGYTVIDSDEIVSDLLENHLELKKQIIKTFNVNNHGNIDKKKLADIIFNDHQQKEKLERYVHPFVIKELLYQAEKARKDKQIIFLDIPLLYEKNLEFICDKIIVVYTKQTLQLERLMKRNQLTKEEATKRIESQMSIEIKKEIADFVFDNNKGLKTLMKQINLFLKENIE